MTTLRVLGGEVGRRGLWARAPKTRSSRGVLLVAAVLVVLMALLSGSIWLTAFSGALLLVAWWVCWPGKGSDVSRLDRWLVRRRHRARVRAGLTRYLAPADEAGTQDRAACWVRPPAVGELSPLDLSGTSFEDMFVLHERNPPRISDALLVVCATEGLGTGLRTGSAYDATAQGFGQLLAAAASSERMLSGIQQLNRVFPHDVTEHVSHVQQALVPPATGAPAAVTEGWDAAVWGYSQAVQADEDSALEHRNLLVLRFEITERFLRLAGRRGGGNEGMARVVRDEVRQLRGHAAAAGLGRIELLGERRATAVTRAAQNPDIRPDRHAGLSWDRDAFVSFNGDATDHLVVDGQWYSRCAYVPRDGLAPAPLGPRWLAPVLTDLPGRVHRTVSLRLDLVSPAVARAEAVIDVTSDGASAASDAAAGRISDGTDEVMLNASQQRRIDLAPGSPHAGVRLALFVMVQARSYDELLDSCASVEEAALKAGVNRLDWCEGKQDLAWATALPLGKGIAGRDDAAWVPFGRTAA